nr:MAG TPA: hypothetical protein [Caudoviricetes sp.]
MLQRRQCPLPGLVVKFFQASCQFRVQRYPAVQLADSAAGRASWKVLLCQVAQIDASGMFFLFIHCAFSFLLYNIKNYPVVIQSLLPGGLFTTTK